MKSPCKRILIAALATLTLLYASATVRAVEEDAGRKALVRQGARLWGPYCGSCHNARPAGERSPAEWDVIMMHMRVRANMPADNARAILEFLKSR